MPFPAPGRHVGFMRKVSFSKIPDGASKTIFAAEKWVHVTLYTTPCQGDDRGWAEGWDFDALRSTLLPPRQDGQDPPPPCSDPTNPGHYALGSAHSGGINAMFADGSVAFISYETDLENLNRMAHRSDGEIVTENL